MEWNLKVIDNDQVYTVQLHQLELWKDDSLPVDDFAPGKKGEAVAFFRMLEDLGISGIFTSACFFAEDGFFQEVSYSELQDAFLLFKEKGQLLKRGFPVRLYVPGSDNDCMNVKSVVTIELR